MSFKAKYRGMCACCGEPFEPGTEVRYTGEGLVVEHEEDHLSRNEILCSKCFTVHAGECL